MKCDCGKDLTVRFGMTRLCPCGAPPRAVREVGELGEKRWEDVLDGIKLTPELLAAEEEMTRQHEHEMGIAECMTPADRGERGEENTTTAYPPPAFPTLEYTPEGPVYRQPIPAPPTLEEVIKVYEAVGWQVVSRTAEAAVLQDRHGTEVRVSTAGTGPAEPPPPAPAAEGVPCCWECGVPVPSDYLMYCANCWATDGVREEALANIAAWSSRAAEVRRPGFVPRRLRK